MDDEKRRLLAKVSYLYFVEGKSQNEISTALDIYRTTVSRMIGKAKEEGIVEIAIKDYDMDVFLLEEYVQKKYGLKRVELVDNQKVKTPIELSECISKRSASLVRHLVREDDIVGISWGSTLSKMVDKIDSKTVKNVVICPLAGGPSHINTKYHVNTLVYEMSRIFNGQTTFINATVVSESAQLATKILGSKHFEELLSLWNNLNVAIVGIGGDLAHSVSQWRDLLTEEDYKSLKNEGAVGEVCCRFVNQRGQTVYSQLQKRIIGITLKQLKNTPNSIAVGYGNNKAQAMLAILKKKYVNHLVTDKATILLALKKDGDIIYK